MMTKQRARGGRLQNLRRPRARRLRSPQHVGFLLQPTMSWRQRNPHFSTTKICARELVESPHDALCRQQEVVV